MKKIMKFAVLTIVMCLGFLKVSSAVAETRHEFINKPPHQVSWTNYDGCSWFQIAGWGFPGNAGYSTVGGAYSVVSNTSCPWSSMRVQATGKYLSGWEWHYEIVLN